MNPTFAGFIQFVRNQGFTATAVPDDSQWLVWAYNIAIELVNQTLQQVSPTIYALAVYNLATSNLVDFCQDNLPDTTWSTLREKLNINGPVFGPVTTASDEGSSVSVEVPDFVKDLSLADLQYIKNPWGRRYVAFAQRCGSIWGLN